MLANQDDFREISSCIAVEDHPLNMSDHPPVLLSLKPFHLRYPTSPAFQSQPPNWVQDEKPFCRIHYTKATDDITCLFLGKDYTSIEEVKLDLQHVCQQLVKDSQKKDKSAGRVHDKTLSHLPSLF